MHNIKRLLSAFALLTLSMVVGVSSVRADSSTPVNTINVNFAPITTTVSFNYDFLTGMLTPGTATATALSINGMFVTTTNDADPPSNGFGTFFGDAHPVHFQGDQVVNTTSVCPGFVNSGNPTTGGGL